ncbi:hypothetical protein PLESTB_000051600 [Pleodorina starrii]|uniref:Glycosyltransferase family 61 protein n=1 Tax=Pleodorina starrii TaxID=330485 RepID=A0A9W6B9J2_9CHLO|nr:hypothetical protein PLESTB_000051600 [Pleodorina starrii]
MSSPNRRHAPSRAQRRWEDVSEWPFQFVILPVLVAFAFCLVLFLGSKHGTRLAAFRTWFHTTLPCKAPHCIQATSLLLQHNARVVEVGSVSAVDPLGLAALAQEDQLKFNFDYWLAEGEKLAGQQTKDCDASYGVQYVEKWRKARMDWCTASSDALLAAATTTTSAALGATGAVQARSGIKRRLHSSSSSSAGTAAVGNKTSTAAAKPSSKPSPSSHSSSSGGGSGSATTASTAAAAAAATSPSMLSGISLYPYHDKDANLLFAVSSNTVLDSRSFLGSLPGEAPEARPGSFAAACHVGSKAPPADEFMGVEAVRRWTKDALKVDEYDKVSAACAVRGGNSSAGAGPHAVEHPVLLLSRYDSTNAFRTVEEVLFAFTALSALRDPRVAKQGIQVVLVDGKPDGFYLDLWAALSRPYPLRILSQQPWPQNTCLSHAVHSTYGGSSIMTSIGVARRTTCRSSVVMAASLWLRHSLGPAIQPPVRSAFGSQRQNKDVVRKSVVWISRRNFEGLAQANLTPWQDQRRFENEGEVVLELQREIWRWNDDACIRSGLTKSFGSGRRLQQLRRLMTTLGLDTAGTTTTAATTATTGASGGGGGNADRRRLAVGLQAREDDTTDQGQEQDVVFAVEGADGQQRQRRLLRGSGGGSRCRASSVFFDLRVVELNDIPFYPDHVQVLGQATVLAGAHGTGLANMIWMAPGKGGVLELHHNSAGNDHYHNQAHLLGHKYVNVESDGDRVNLAAAAEGLRKLLDVLGS